MTDIALDHRSPHAGRAVSRRHGWILAVLALSQLMIVLDATIVDIALSSAQEDLGFGTDQRQWVVIAYSLAFGSLVLLGGRVSDLSGRKLTYIIGFAGFATASAVGGILTEYTTWRWTLFVNLFFAVAAIIGAVVFFGNTQKASQRPKMDAIGSKFVVIGPVCIVYGFSSAETNGWDSPATIASLALGVVLVAAFVVVERRVEHPLLPMRVLLDRTRGASYLTIALVGVALFTVFLFLTHYLQTRRGYSPIRSGVAFLPLPIAVFVTSTSITPWLIRRFGHKPLIVVGTLLGAASLVLLSTITLTSNYWLTVAVALVILGVGSSTFNAATANIDPRDAGVGSAMVNTAQQVGGATGTAVLSSIAQGTVTRFLQEHGTSTAVQVQAQLASYNVAFLTSAGIIALTSVITAFLLRGARPANNHLPAATATE